MAICKTRGIVLRRFRYGNSSRIVSFFTEDHGRVAAMARGARRVKSVFGGGLEPFVAAELILYLKKGRMVQTVTSSDIDETFSSVRDDMRKTVFAEAACEMVDRLSEEEGNPPLFRLLYAYLRHLGTAVPGREEVYFWSFQLKLFDLLGYRPDLRHCSQCGEELTVPGKDIHFYQGGLVCGSCVRSEDAAGTITAGTVRLLDKLTDMPFTQTGNYRILGRLHQEGSRFLEYYFLYHSGQRRPLVALKSLAYVNSMEQIRRNG